YGNVSKQDQITTKNNEEENFILPMNNSNLLFIPTLVPIDEDLELENNTFNAKKKEKETNDNNHKSTEKVT
ncbi:16257_t:CDS:2, partial [Dentiscutata erythropus]